MNAPFPADAREEFLLILRGRMTGIPYVKDRGRRLREDGIYRVRDGSLGFLLIDEETGTNYIVGIEPFEVMESAPALPPYDDDTTSGVPSA